MKDEIQRERELDPNEMEWIRGEFLPAIDWEGAHVAGPPVIEDRYFVDLDDTY